jgi:hypothetical protein
VEQGQVCVTLVRRRKKSERPLVGSGWNWAIRGSAAGRQKAGPFF